MSVRKCIAAECPFLSLSLDNDRRHVFVCATDYMSKLSAVPVSEVVEAGREYNRWVREPVEPCSFWEGVEECSQEDYRRAVSQLRRQLSDVVIFHGGDGKRRGS